MKAKISSVLLVFIMLAFYSQAQKMHIDTEKSSIHWIGKKVGGQHDGHVKFKEGNFTNYMNSFTNGSFVVDMTTITCLDLTEKEWNDKLVNHLKSDDFFGVEKYPTAKLEITGSDKIKDDKVKVKGNLTIKETTLPVEFTVSLDGGGTYTTTLVIDRSKFDVRYGSKSFFDNLGDKMIYDEFTLEIKIVVK